MRGSSERISVEDLKPGEEKLWDAFVTTNPAGTIYHSIAWKATVEEGFGHQAHYLRAVDETGRIVGVLPLFLVSGIFGRRLVSVPMRDRGGVVAETPAAEAALVSSAIARTKKLRGRYLELRQFDALPAEIVTQYGLVEQRHWITTRIDLCSGVDKLWKALDRNAIQWAINKARKNGIHFTIEDDHQSLQLFFEMFVRARCRMGIPPFPRRFFNAIWRHLVRNGHANVFFVRKGNEPIHAMINFFSGVDFIPAYAAPQNEWRKEHPNEFMIWSTIQWAAEHEFKVYDFGADSPTQLGLLWFKKKWGGVQHPMQSYFLLNGIARPPMFDSSSPEYAWARKAWRKLPLSLGSYLGSVITRQLS